MKHFYLSLICLLATTFGLYSCSNNDGSPFAKFDAYDKNLGKRIDAYYSATLSSGSVIQETKPSMYIDFSDGIFQAFNANSANNINSTLIKSITATLSGDVQIFMLDRDSIKPMSNSNSSLVDKMIVDESNYKGIYAPIKGAIDKIVTVNSDALLVTDFEDYYPTTTRMEVLATAHFKEAFVKWLSKGNGIRFYISDYQEKGINKHLYFTIFCHGDIQNNPMLKKIETALGNANITLPYFDLTNKPYTLSQEYATVKAGGIFYDSTGKNAKSINILDMQGNEYINGLPNAMPFEFYRFGLDWSTIEQLKQQYQKAGQFEDFFRHLYIDASKEDSYIIGDFAVKVYDVSDDYTHFSHCHEVLQHKPKLATGGRGESKFADDEKDIIALACYDTTGNIKKEWIYTTHAAKPIAELFDINKILLTNTSKSSAKKKIELGVMFHPNFNAKNITGALLRIDIVIANATVNLSNPLLNSFQWPSINQAGKQNIALLESIKSTLQDEKVNPTNKTIYSYYIKTLN